MRVFLPVAVSLVNHAVRQSRAASHEKIRFWVRLTIEHALLTMMSLQNTPPIQTDSSPECSVVRDASPSLDTCMSRAFNQQASGHSYLGVDK